VNTAVKPTLNAEPEPERCLSSERQLELWLGFDAVYADAKSSVIPGTDCRLPKSNKIASLKVMSGAMAGTPVSCMSWIKTTVGA
jgi:hypothetical protein